MSALQSLLVLLVPGPNHESRRRPRSWLDAGSTVLEVAILAALLSVVAVAVAAAIRAGVGGALEGITTQ